MVSAGQIADALSARYGPTVLRYRFTERDHEYNFVQDLSAAFEDASIELDNSRPVIRTATFSIIRGNLPASLDLNDVHIAVTAQVLVNGAYADIPLGVFHIDVPALELRPDGAQVQAKGSDLAVHLLTSKLDSTYLVPSGTNYVTAVEAVIEAAIPMEVLQHSIPATAETTPEDFVWAPGTSRYDLAAQLLAGINYFAPWADETGTIVSRERVLPSGATAAIEWSTLAEPRMIEGPFSIAPDLSRFANRIVVENNHPLRTPYFAIRINDDADSPISVTSLGGVVNSDPPLNGALTPDVDAAEAIAEYEIEDRAVRSKPAKLVTAPDPRRRGHEYYRLTIDSEEVQSLWRVEGWSLDLRSESHMEHRLARVQAIDQSIEVALSGTILETGEAGIVSGGATIILTLNNEAWVASGGTFNAIRQDIIDGLTSTGTEAGGWNTEVRDNMNVSEVVRTSDTIVTITLAAQAGYSITLDETIEVAVPASAISGALTSVTRPKFTIAAA